jgi:hypothetical protein
VVLREPRFQFFPVDRGLGNLLLRTNAGLITQRISELERAHFPWADFE